MHGGLHVLFSSATDFSVVTDSREWRRLKTLFEVFSETEENMFTNQAGMVDQSGLKYPQIFLRGKESVNVPFKLQTFLSRMPVPEQKTASNPFAMEQSYSVVEKNFNERLRPKQIQVRLSFIGTGVRGRTSFVV